MTKVPNSAEVLQEQLKALQFLLNKAKRNKNLQQQNDLITKITLLREQIDLKKLDHRNRARIPQFFVKVVGIDSGYPTQMQTG
jgi:tetrahydrodipicolinate N-succinyltransferase